MLVNLLTSTTTTIAPTLPVLADVPDVAFPAGPFGAASLSPATLAVLLASLHGKHPIPLATARFIGMLANLTDAELEIVANWSSHINGNRSSICRQNCYCSGQLRDFLRSYREVHGYIALVVCLFGTVANALNVVVLTRKELSAAPINRILTWLAVADMLVMVEYVPFACYMYLVLPERKDFPLLGAWFVLFHSHFTQVLHTISICLTLALAIWRYISIRYPQHTHTLCSQRRCSIAILCSYVLPAFVCLPQYLTFSVNRVMVREDSQVTFLYHLGLSDLAKERDELLFILNFWVYAVLIKLLPCAILTVIIVWLIRALYNANRRKAELRGYSAVAVLGVQNGGPGHGHNPAPTSGTALTAPGTRRPTRTERRTDRTTRMLVAILLLFLITELPQGILGLLSGILGHKFFSTCYHMFGESMDILALLNGAINFILYCAMSRQFRTTFGQLFKPHRLMAKLQGGATSQTEVQSTYV